MMKQDYIVVISADNNFSVLNRIINVLNRRRVRIRKLVAHEEEDNIRRGGATLHLHTTPDLIVKVKLQLEKLIEVDNVTCVEGDADFFESLYKNELIVEPK